LIIKLSNIIENLKEKVQPVPAAPATASAKSQKKRSKERGSAVKSTEINDEDKKVFKVGKVKDPKPPTSLEPATVDSSQKKKPSDKKVQTDKKVKKPKNIEKTENTKEKPAKLVEKKPIEVTVETITEPVEEKKIEEINDEELVEDEGLYNITLIQRNDSQSTETTEAYRPSKRQPNLPNAPPPQQIDPNQLTEEELARQKELEMSVSLRSFIISK
jgi:hypothetical protein